jgi:hypothetical protein
MRKAGIEERDFRKRSPAAAGKLSRRGQHGQIRSHFELIGKVYEKEISIALRGLILFERNVGASR